VHAGVDQQGSECAKVTADQAQTLLVSAEEPFAVQVRAAQLAALTDEGHTSAYSTPRSRRSSSNSVGSRTSLRSEPREVPYPAWMMWLAGSIDRPIEKNAKVKISRRDDGKEFYHRGPAPGGANTKLTLRELNTPLAVREGTQAPVRKRYHAEAVVPFAVPASSAPVPAVVTEFQVPKAPPIIDLATSEFEIDWPMLLGELMERCCDLPTIIPPHNWRHTATGGVGSNWLARLDAMAVTEYAFSTAELEVVCRAWNTLVAATWVRKSPGLSAYANRDHLEFCLRYFQSYFNLMQVG